MTAELALLTRWFGMVGPLLCAGAPLPAVAAALEWEVRHDLSATVIDDDEMTTLVKALGDGVALATAAQPRAGGS